MPRGRPKKIPVPAQSVPKPYKTPEQLKGKMMKYFEECRAQDDVFPDEAGMRIYLDLGSRSYREYMEDPAYELVFDWAKDMRESWAARGLANNPRSAQAFLNILKQEGNGGWIDRKTDKGDKTITIKTDGVGGLEAFK